MFLFRALFFCQVCTIENKEMIYLVWVCICFHFFTHLYQRVPEHPVRDGARGGPASQARHRSVVAAHAVHGTGHGSYYGTYIRW